MAATIFEIAHQEQQLTDSLQDLSIHDQSEMMEEEKMKGNGTYAAGEMTSVGCESSSGVADSHFDNNSPHHDGVCAICLNHIILQETALVKGCEHAYCVNCILHWASYKKEPTCPQCKQPFESLNIHRSLDGSIHDYMFEESVCLLLRATWYKPLIVEERDEVEDDMGYFYSYAYEDEEEEEMDEIYFGGSSSIRIGNRRWGDNGYVRAGRQEARPIPRPNTQESGAGPSRQPRKKETAAARESPAVGRRAKRALKREAADKAAAAKHQQHLARLGRK
ncbi:uncharacterized protein LOC113779701 [Coffea eugenioides]|uniref:uncharacterized protein LOC113779701 n=1 Tax=Coffea eugenioides TaxID=49369 RepID=UPI000F60AC72|nr:uncharacterized protein LOC113779701 [Coffea eugenioides]